MHAQAWHNTESSYSNGIITLYAVLAASVLERQKASHPVQCETVSTRVQWRWQGRPDLKSLSQLPQKPAGAFLMPVPFFLFSAVPPKLLVGWGHSDVVIRHCKQVDKSRMQGRRRSGLQDCMTYSTLEHNLQRQFEERHTWVLVAWVYVTITRIPALWTNRSRLN